MAYAEKRGKSWRVRYQKPDGTWASESGFPTKSAALARGRELESDVQRGTYIDPRKGQTPFKDWAQTWMTAQKVEGRTVERRYYLLDTHLLPKWGKVPLLGINWFEVRAWLDGGMTCAESTRRDAATLLSMMLTGAADAGYIPVNPLYQRRRTASKKKRDAKVWAYPDQVLAIADRPASRADRLMIITAAWTGMRWGELCGLHRDNCGLLRRDRDGTTTLVRRVIRIDPDVGALHEVAVRMTEEDLEEWEKQERARLGKAERAGRPAKPKKPPKNRVEVYLGSPKPPNGAREIDIPPFLAQLLDEHMAAWPHPHLFVGPDGHWHRRNNWNARVIAPAADGRPGKPRTRGRAEIPAWEPILPGQRLHGFRHGHKTWMIEDDIPEVLQCEQMGHELDGIRGVYSHPSVAMRKKRLDALQARWERAQKERRKTA
jgi:integrase